MTRIYAEVAKTTNIGISCDLKCKSGKRLVIARMALNPLFALIARVSTLNSFNIKRRGQISANSIKHGLYALVLERRTANYREELHRERTLTDSCTDFCFGDSSRILKVLLHDNIIEVSTFLEHLIAPFLSLSQEISRDILNIIISTLRLIMPVVSLHLNKVNNALEGLFCTDRKLDWTSVCTKYIMDLASYLKEVSTRTVHFVHIADTRNIVLVCLTPYRLRLGLNATNSTISSHCAIEDAERTFYLSREIHVPRSVDEVELILLSLKVPISSCSCRGNSNTTLLLLLHPVHGSCTIVHLTNFVGQTGIEKNTLRGSGLTGIDVSHNADIAIQTKIVFSHCFYVP